MIGVSDNRRCIPFENKIELIRKVPVMVAFMCNGTALTTGYRYTTQMDLTDPVWEIVRDAIGFRGLSQLLGPKSLC